MTLFDPETFSDDPYVAGLNQGAHMIAGAALLVGLLPLWPLDVVLGVTLALILAFELWQYIEREAALWDVGLDLLFWGLGAFAWYRAIDTGDVTGSTILYPLWLTLIMGGVMAVFTLFKHASKE
ncbi:hypothetical protein KX928_12540 [Roseobacter sp. YSTF-M11]|uniref:Uncharacterized protein n=1 Tax=Roseobacter insulae TaxID=2859783 RepID=A0A9X1K3H3_9RHOB|nr:hypothetical protein [Roseobacter insulae]MBW4708612.1 hypothetical protein [Roseobacter insulae]